jgi:dipeptidyl-peptidase III
MAPMSRAAPTTPTASTDADRIHLIERVDEAAVVQLYADGFRGLSTRDKILVWHLYQAAIAGRDIFYDQRYAHSLEMRDVLEAVVALPEAARAAIDADTFREIVRYTKLFWINSGPYNNLTARKFVLSCTPHAFAAAVAEAERAGSRVPRRPDEPLDALLERLRPMFFDVAFHPSVTCKTPPDGQDILTASANNLYSGLAMKDLDGVTERFPQNSRLAKVDGIVVEEPYRIGARYSRQISEIVAHLTAAIAYAPPATARALQALIKFYTTGEDSDREAYDIAWVQDKDSTVDTINGFVEVYLDARSIKGAWEALVCYVNREKTTQIRTIAEHAQWFEERMPWAPKYRKQNARGVTANAIDVVVETGDSGPVTPVGINLPNDQRVREEFGSKSVSLSNVAEAYDRSTLPEFRSEFAWSRDEFDRAMRWSSFAGELTTNMHEVIGHGSGKVDDRLGGNPQAALREQFSAIEESRADLVALYFLPDAKLVDLGLIDAADHDEVVRAEYEAYARNALVQLRRIRQGTTIEEDHMRNRQMVVHWLMANTSAIEKRRRDGKTFYVMVDPKAFRDGVGRLLAEVQRIKGEGDYDAARQLFETFGVHFDSSLRDEVVARVDRLNLPSYTGFVMPSLKPVTGADGSIKDVEISYPLDLTKQMLDYASRTRASRD